MDILLLFTHEPIASPAATWPHLEIGASVEFLGIVREKEGEASLPGLFYEAHETMAERQLRRHFADLAQLHACEAVTFIHRLGWVPVGEPSLFIRILARHRREAFACCAQLIDLLKQDVPIWKRLTAPGA